MRFLYFIFRFLPVQKNKIVLWSFNNKYGCNPKYIAEELLKNKEAYKIVWLSKRAKCVVPASIKSVCSKIGWCYEISTAKVIIANSRMGGIFNHGFRKKKGQTYIQTWHGSLGIKKMEGDCDNLSHKYIKSAKKDSANIDFLISNSRWMTDCYRSSFFYDGPIKEFGNARNDIFFKDGKDVVKRVKDYYGILENQKVILYAPTFRDDKDFSCYSLDYQRLLEALGNKFGSEWVVISRLHPNLRKYKNILPDLPNVFDGSDYPDIQELLCCADIMISDYSSCIFDFVLSRKPAFIFATDIDVYGNSRGFCYSLESTPFPIAVDNKQMMENILAFDEGTYQNNVEAFLDGKGVKDDGLASSRIVQLVQQCINDKGE